MSAAASAPVAQPAARAKTLSGWWPLAALTLLAALLRLPTLSHQSLWYDEAFTPVHVLHQSLWATLRSVSHTENSPPLWYILEWLFTRALGTGEFALRLLSALAGIAAVPVAWAIGRELAGRRAAIGCAALLACGPLFVWYSQEARAYELFVLTSAVAMLAFLRAERDPRGATMALFALTGALALLTHYFAVFLLAPMCLWLLWQPRTRRASLVAIAVIVATGAALLPLVLAQGGHGTQWIGRWPLSERLAAIPQYYLTGASGEPLGHGVEVLVALPLLAAAAVGLLGILQTPAAGAGEARAAELARERRGAAIAGLIAACGVLVPVLLAIAGADYLAPRNLVGAMVPVSALLAVLATSPRAGLAGPLLLGIGIAGLLGLSVDVQLSPRLQRGDWRGLAAALRKGPAARVISTVQLGSAPLEYYIHGLNGLPAGASAVVREIDETGYSPLRASAGTPPVAGFRLLGRTDVNGLLAYRFVSPIPRAVAFAPLRAHVITLARPEVLVTSATPVRR
jgi:4-amino-4-deoxy-L-arabinose transferase-like glycosyltransferase